MRGSAHAGERAAAEVKAAEIVVRFGYTLDQVEHLLATNGEPYPAAGEESRKQDQRNSTWHRQQQEDDRRRFQRWASRREAVIRRYGNLEAAVAWQPREKLLRQAVEHLCDVEAVSPDWVHLLDGWDDGIDDKPTRRIIELVCKSYPLPTSITDAQAEYDHWEERGRDWVAIFPYHEYSYSDFQLDLPSLLRYKIVTNLLETDLRAASVGEVLLRQRHLSELEHLDDIQKAILKDLEYLASIEPCGTVQNGQSTNSSGPHQTTTTTAHGCRRSAVQDGHALITRS